MQIYLCHVMTYLIFTGLISGDLGNTLLPWLD